jgi:hypothetical protein
LFLKPFSLKRACTEDILAFKGLIEAESEEEIDALEFQMNRRKFKALFFFYYLAMFKSIKVLLKLYNVSEVLPKKLLLSTFIFLSSFYR